ncbi:MAG: class I SAM-dependent methyltransferase [Pseudomonadota bacterium]
MNYDDYYLRACNVCTNNDYTKLAFSEQVFKTDHRSALFQCNHCGMTPYFATYQLDNRKLLEEEYYLPDGKGEYTARSATENAYKKVVRENLKWAQSILNLPEKSKLLDVGCGEGILLEEATKIGFDCDGIEPSHDQCAKHQKNGLKAHQGLLEDYQNQFKNQFDVITLSWVFDHFMNPKESIEIIHQMLKQQGYVIMMQSTMLDVPLFRYKYAIAIPHQKAFSGILPNKTTAFSHPYYYTKQSLNNLLVSVGFEYYAEKSNQGLKPVFIFKKASSSAKSTQHHIDFKPLNKTFYLWYLRDRFYTPVFKMLFKLLKKD